MELVGKDSSFFEINNELADKGIFRHLNRRNDYMGADRVDLLGDLGACLLCDRNDAGNDAALRPRAVRLFPAGFASAERSDDRRWHTYEQDGSRAAQGLRSDAGAALCDLDGVVRQWRRLLPLLVLGGARLRSHRARRHLRARLPADCGSAALRRDAAAEKDSAHRHHRALRSCCRTCTVRTATMRKVHKGKKRRADAVPRCVDLATSHPRLVSKATSNGVFRLCHFGGFC